MSENEYKAMYDILRREYKKTVKLYTADHTEVARLRAELASETRWANEYHLAAEAAVEEIKRLRAELAKVTK